MRIATANIRNNPDMPRAQVVADARTVGAVADVIFFQEIGEAEDHVDIARGLGPGFVVEHFGRNQNPIAYRRGTLKPTTTGYRTFHNGLAKISPSRGATWIETEAVVYVNTHFVSGAFNGRVDPAEKWRVDHWNEHFADLRSLVRSFMARGLTVVFGGDFNRHEVGKFDLSQSWLINPVRGIDKVAIIPAHGVTFRAVSKPAVPLNSDHDARVVDLTIRSPRARTFTAATWAPGALGAVAFDHAAETLRADGVSVLLVPEALSGTGARALTANGFKTLMSPTRAAIVYDPAAWEVSTSDTSVALSSTTYFSTAGDPRRPSAVRATLRHRSSGRTLDVVAFTAPPNVQPGLGASNPRRVTVLREIMATLSTFARQKTANAVLYGGSDNVDEFNGDGAGSGFWDFLLAVRTGLRQVRAPQPTSGARRIDDFRTHSLKIGRASVRDLGGTRRVHVREFTLP